jgi:sulfur carrier protein ThiS
MSAKDNTKTKTNLAIDDTTAAVETKPARRRPPAKTAAAKKAAAAKQTAAVQAPAPVVLSDVTFNLLILGQDPQTMTLPGGESTVGDMLTSTVLSGKDGETLVNSVRVKYDHQIKEGDQVVFASKIKGGLTTAL